MIVMIPKPGKDHTKVKGWRPMVLANTMGKWCESQRKRRTMHPLSFAARNGRGAMDSIMLMDQLRKDTVYGKDIKSAFNSVERGGNL